ncbi:type II toxin-antitoxin system VapC family toxin [Mucilaginibacter terrae]|uniref:type II toxin-antitoxin system VapC family toxin n=1 Tax=Mucilaginibacter terrae TaxID=1955052 RepID=UPI003632CF1D
MQFLIDTHVLIWYLDGSEKLPDRIRNIINDTDNDIIVSIVSLWEVVIKTSKHKRLSIDITFADVYNHIVDRDYLLLNVSLQHLNTLETLTLHHGDPFDRMLIAQALTEGLTIISADRQFDAYPANVSW